ncbi:uncharacterized protein LOC126788857 [Argentina anserina]|uniref:uncharacterized protein LOC126788857 n=1 Tax=Argentina anserina TaxID=57926 RepID=UPI00217624D7|nr:uncharacterized protein LOC126788857 [Potentilla anserina]
MGRKIRTSLEFESGKEKKTHKKKGKDKANKDEFERNLSVLDVGRDEMAKEVEDPKYDKSDGIHMNSGERANKKKKRKREKEGDGMIIENMSNKKELINEEEKVGKTLENVDSTGHVKKRKKILEDGITGMATEYGDVAIITKNGGKKKKKEKREYTGCELERNTVSNGMEAEVASQQLEGCTVDTTGLVLEERMKEKRNRGKKLGTEMQDSVAEDAGTDSNRKSDAVNVENSKKRKKSKSQKHGIVEVCYQDKKKTRSSSSKGNLRSQKSIGAPDNSEKSAPKKALKRVSFADDVEVYSLSDGSSDEHDDLVRGKRFSEEEDKIVKEAVLRYIEERALGNDGLDMVMRSKSHPEVKNHPELKTCWKDIGAALPWRPFKSVYYRAHILFERAEKRKWTHEEYEEVRKFQKDKGADWRTLGDKLGKHRIHVKDAWRRIKLPNQKKGRWSQEEYETLFDLVNMDLRVKVFEEKKTKHGMLRDNICWEAISETLGTRTNAVCSMKWYNQLTSPLVSQKLWGDIDDYRLLDALNRLDACCIEDVDWDDLLEHRPGDVCQKRWYQMVKHIGQHALKSFPEQVEVLSKRYLADLIEAREIYANKPAVD